MFFWIRYYTIALLIFDAVQIHSFARKGVPNTGLCLAMDPTIRIVGAISLWSIEIVMQLRIYALYGRSKKIALFNGVLFMISIGCFVGLIVDSSKRRKIVIASAMQFPLPGCPTINGGIRWAVWVPATLFEFNLFVLALYKSAVSRSAQVKLNGRLPLSAVLLQDNILYFLGIACILVLNNIMAIGTTPIPWFGYGPFHGALGIMTTRMHIHLTKVLDNEDTGTEEFTQLVETSPSIPDFGIRRSVIREAVFKPDTDRVTEASSSSTQLTEPIRISMA